MVAFIGIRHPIEGFTYFRGKKKHDAIPQMRGGANR